MHLSNLRVYQYRFFLVVWEKRKEEVARKEWSNNRMKEILSKKMAIISKKISPTTWFVVGPIVSWSMANFIYFWLGFYQRTRISLKIGKKAILQIKIRKRSKSQKKAKKKCWTEISASFHWILLMSIFI